MGRENDVPARGRRPDGTTDDFSLMGSFIPGTLYDTVAPSKFGVGCGGDLNQALQTEKLKNSGGTACVNSVRREGLVLGNQKYNKCFFF